MNAMKQQKNNITNNADPLQKLFAVINQRISHGKNVYLRDGDGTTYVVYPKNVLYVRKGRKYEGANKFVDAIYIYYPNKLITIWFVGNQLHVYDEKESGGQ